MDSILPGTIEEPGLDTGIVGTLEAPRPAAPGLALEAVRLTPYWPDGARPAFAPLVAGTRAEGHFAPR